MNTLDRITVDPQQMKGQPCAGNMRLTVRWVIEALVIYRNWDDLMLEYPELDPEDIKQCFAYAATSSWNVIHEPGYAHGMRHQRIDWEKSPIFSVVNLVAISTKEILTVTEEQISYATTA